MRSGTPVKARAPALVAVISSQQELKRALLLRRLPDFFEVRLDALFFALAEVERAIPKLGAPLIITARHPAEGGFNRLSAADRRTLLLRFLHSAAFVDLELRSAKALRPVLDAAQINRIRLIVSAHLLGRTPTVNRMKQIARDALQLSPAVLKLVIRTDTPAQLQRLLEIYDSIRHDLPTSAMGFGKLGRKSRILLAQRGSLLNYVHLGRSAVEGQLGLGVMRSRHLSS